MAVQENHHNSHIAIIKVLLEGGADPNAPNQYGVTPFHLCVRKNNCKDTVNLILDYQVDIKKRIVREILLCTSQLELAASKQRNSSSTQVPRLTS